MKTAITLSSANSKVGHIPTTYTSKESCPSSCPLNHKNSGGCYAESGPLNIHWTKISEGKRGMEYDAFIESIKKLPRGQFFRHNVAGDLYGKDEKIDIPKLVELVMANKGKKG